MGRLFYWIHREKFGGRELGISFSILILTLKQNKKL